eukprot:TRINITY_DN11646_c0_g1_i3.p1 TRINITY_DN11646_c0_g1~~TRINITY_DN11646_c0_g1_i3.p1  ORF type:complete len:325 (+),score=66.00 TRINITY_DN11646_c0_g1_i3:76-1050(+)
MEAVVSTQSTGVSEEMITQIRSQYDKNIKDLMALGGGVTEEEIIRLFFVLQMSAFGSGVYLHFSLFNHQCHPNCIKFTPPETDLEMKVCSQVRATRLIKPGEELTISYLDPCEQTRQRRHRLLANQFGFIPSDNPVDILKDNLLEKLKDGHLLDDHVKELINGWEDQLDLLHKQTNRKDSDPYPVVEKLCEELQSILDPRHIVLLRANKMLLELLHPKLSEPETKTKDRGKKNKQSKEDVFGMNLVKYLRVAYEVYKTQLLALSKDHIDLATTLNDMSIAIESLLAWNSSILFKEFPQWDTFQKATKFQNYCETTFGNLHQMYS